MQRRHPIVLTLFLIMLSPYILAAALLYVVCFVLATVLDTFAGRR